MKTPFVLGLTGSIGMGKSTTSQFFRQAGIPVWDADAAVHKLYSGDTPAVAKIRALIPGSVQNKTVNRDVLKREIARDKTLLHKIESIVQPLVSQSRVDFTKEATEKGVALIVIDHPLLFETGSTKYCDAVLVVSVSAAEQRERVLGRGTMTPEMFEMILSKQLPDVEKRARADFVIETTTLESAKKQVLKLISKLTGKPDA